ncbi:uncharacterized protein LOC126681917 [Mercurialis annua]|uniref:uncharacterized protein LOC126681917 n=1 Tax=Mercurialis annua TaxID=3986 RepID=UPI0024AC8B7C|nr:uncharacterized protein LOC126681917 [Mercurialis annua]
MAWVHVGLNPEQLGSAPRGRICPPQQPKVGLLIMERYFKKISDATKPIIPPRNQAEKLNVEVESSDQPTIHVSPIPIEMEIDLDNLPSDPGLRPNIMSYSSDVRDQVRREYLLKGPCQPRQHIFPQRMDGNRKRKFIVTWFDEFKPWLEYSIAKDAAFCLYCYLFSAGRSERGHDAFVTEGFNAWRKKERLTCQNLMNQAQHIEVCFSKQSEQAKLDYRCRLNASIICLRYLMMQGLAFRGNDETENSLNQGNFIKLLKVIASCNEDINKVVLSNAPDNLKLTAPHIQKDIINAAAIEITNVIIEDIGNNFFSILVDECRDVSIKEQMGIVIRYVNKSGCIIERFLGLVHVNDTSAASLKKGIDSLFSTYGLSISSLRGQGYDGASNMRGEFNGLKSLILKENSQAYYIHCFAHQLQLTLVAVAKNHVSVSSFFNTVARLCNDVSGSCKRMDMLREKQLEKILQGIENDEIMTGRGLNQQRSLKRPSDTRWSSHYGTLMNLIHLFSSITDVLEYIGENVKDDPQKAEAVDLLDIITRF